MKSNCSLNYLFVSFCLGLALLSSPVVLARGPGLANVTILATGGTIAGTGATSTTTVGYTPPPQWVSRASSKRCRN